MAVVGYQASHEQFAPSELIKFSVLAEANGFGAINSSDHFHPWSKRQGHSGFAFAWLGAAMAQTKVPFGLVCAPGQRYHPAIIAQAIATIGEMFPSRFWIALGSGEALNERITGDKWPAKPARQERLLECASIIRRLLDGEVVTHHGHVIVEEAQLYTRAPIRPLLIGAAVTAETAAWVGSWADGMITISKPLDELQETIAAFRGNGGEGKPIYLKVQLSYDHSEKEALDGAYDQWRTNIFSGTVLGELWKVEQFDAIGEMVRPEQMKDMVNISADIGQHLEWIQQYVDLGFEKIILHNVNRRQEAFIKDFGKHVLPRLSSKTLEFA